MGIHHRLFEVHVRAHSRCRVSLDLLLTSAVLKPQPDLCESWAVFDDATTQTAFRLFAAQSSSIPRPVLQSPVKPGCRKRCKQGGRIHKADRDSGQVNGLRFDSTAECGAWRFTRERAKSTVRGVRGDADREMEDVAMKMLAIRLTALRLFLKSSAALGIYAYKLG